MNIFVLNENPTRAAQDLCDKHLSKMLIESGQMLATALRQHGLEDDDLLAHGVVTSKGTPWRSTHVHHPCTRWASATRGNYEWLAHHALAIGLEYHRRFGKVHACSAPVQAMLNLSASIPAGSRTPFALAMPDEFRSDDAVESYRAFYHTKTFAAWARASSPPSWWRGVIA